MCVYTNPYTLLIVTGTLKYFTCINSLKSSPTCLEVDICVIIISLVENILISDEEIKTEKAGVQTKIVQLQNPCSQ